MCWTVNTFAIITIIFICFDKQTATQHLLVQSPRDRRASPTPPSLTFDATRKVRIGTSLLASSARLEAARSGILAAGDQRPAKTRHAPLCCREPKSPTRGVFALCECMASCHLTPTPAHCGAVSIPRGVRGNQHIRPRRRCISSSSPVRPPRPLLHE